MKHISRLLLHGCVVTLALTLGTSFAVGQAQNKPGKPPGSAATQPNDPAAAKPEKPGSVTQPGRDAKDRSDQEGSKASDTEAQVLRKIMLEEAKHRKRLAAIKRLRELATEQGNQQRLQALDKLEEKLTLLYERKTQGWRERLGQDKYAQLQNRLNKGKGAGRGRGPSTGRGRSDTGDVSSSRGKNKPGSEPAGEQQGAPSGSRNDQPQSGGSTGTGKDQSGSPDRSADDHPGKEKGTPQGGQGKGRPDAEKGKGPGKRDPEREKGGGS
jgi:hypothetical protein